MRTAGNLHALRCLLLFCLILCPHLSRAQGEPSKEDLATAKRHYDQGAKFYEAGNYQSAREEFKEAYRLTRLPDLLFNLSRVEERLDHSDEAIKYLEQYLKERPEAPDRPDIQKKIDKLREQQQEAEEKAQREKEAREREAADRAARQKALSQTPVPTPQPERRRWNLPPWPALALLGGGTGLLIIGIGLGGGAIATARAVESSSHFDPSLDARGRALSNAAIVFDVLGVAALAAGGTWTGLWYYQHRTNKSSVRATLRPYGTGLALSGTF